MALFGELDPPHSYNLSGGQVMDEKMALNLERGQVGCFVSSTD